ncbi:hypothetical protein A9Q99_04290 [Gammaproteobacteria bacterium 45_16_T64]|nr:hypothetical protein A9Q99_04290 [Gammaproteobacteria bacterium 45_16_T64]
MSVVELLSSLAKKDIRLWLDGENLRFSAPEGAFTPEIKNQIVSNKPAIMEFLKQAQKATAETIPCVSRDKPLRASYGQQRLWLLDQLNPGDVTYNMPTALRIKGFIDPNILDQAFQAIVARHEVLRTHFEEKDGEPYQVIRSDNAWTLDRLDVSDLESQDKETQIQHCVNEDALTSFDLSAGPLFRGKLITVNTPESGEPEFVLIACMHHIISDGWSMEVLVKEMMAFYMAKAANSPSVLPELPIQYADYSEWQRGYVESDEQKAHLDYWIGALEGAPSVLKLPSDKPRSELVSNRGAVHKFDMPAALFVQVESFCDKNKLTPYMVTLGAWQLLLSRFVGSNDVVVGAPVAGRDRGETQDLIGFFVNLLMLRLKIDNTETSEQFFQRVKTMVLDGFSHQDLPIDMLMEAMSIERQPGYSPLAQAAFQLINVQSDAESTSLGMGPLEVSEIPSASASARMEMVLGVARLDASYSGSLEYNTDLFSESTIATLVNQYQHLLLALTSDKQLTIESIQLFSDDELLSSLGVDAETHSLLPLNTYQRDFYLAYKVNPDSFENSYGISVDIEMPLDEATLAEAVKWVAKQHSLLLSSLIESHLPGTDDAYLVVEHNRSISLNRVEVEGDLASNADLLMHKPIDLLQDSLIRAYLLLNATGQQKLVLCYHHLLVDGASAFLHMDAILDCYETLRNGGSPSPVTSSDTSRSIVANSDYQQWDKQNVDSDAVIAFWKDTLKTVEPLQFSMPETYRKRENINAFNDETVSLTIEGELFSRVRAYCQGLRISFPLFFKGIYGILVQHYCRAENDFHIAEFNGNRRNASDSDLGCFYQQIPMVFPNALFANDAQIADLFKYEKEYRAKTQAYRSISLSEQANILPQAPAVFMYNYYNFVLTRNVQGALVSPVMSTPKVERGVQLIVGELQESIDLTLRYDLDSFVDLSLLDRLVSVAQQIVDVGVNQFSQLSYITDSEREELQVHGKQLSLQTNARSFATIVEWFQFQTAKSEKSIAVIYGDLQLTYGELNQKSNQLARYLVSEGVVAGSRVGICLERSADLIVSIFGVLKAGGAYVPMDANYPKERLAFLMADCQAPTVISHSTLVDRLPAFDGKSLLIDQAWDAESSSGLQQLSDDDLNLTISDNDPIYTIYTSGSTGQPKGAAVTHRGELNLQQWYTEEMAFGKTTNTLLISAVGFDLTQKNLFAALLQGGTLVIPQMDLFDEELLVDLIKQHQVSVVNCAPSAFYPLVETAAFDSYESLSSLRHVVLGGEPIQLSLLYSWLANDNSHAQIINSYGPTECTDVVAFYRLTEITSPDQNIPIGLPIQNTQLYLLTDNNQLVAPGCVGELCIAGTGVGLGYLNRDELTRSVFIENPFGDGLLYRTGDLVRYQKDGNLVYVGRKDFQIKLRGLRIELGEIEWSLQQLPEVKDGLVLLKNDELVAYVVSEQAEIAEWRQQLRDHLPEYMVPSALVVLAQWPLTPNGKVDRKALPEPTDAESARVEYIAPRSELETQLVSIWSEVLDAPQIGVLDNLFDLGGNSLLATRIISRVKKAFDIEVQVRDLFVSPTVSDLAMLVRHAQQGGVSKAPAMMAVDKSQPLPISFAQQRLWFLDQLDPGTPVYNMPGAIRLDGVLDADLLNKVFSEIVNRHDSLRTGFISVDEQPMQVIADKGEWVVEFSDISHLPAEDRDLEALRQAQNEVSFSFDLEVGPLIRTRLLKLSDTSHVLIVNMHHIISDGWSNGILMQDLVSIYDAFSHGRPSPLPDLAIQYADFSVWQRNWLQGDVLQEQIDYWTSKLQDVPVLELPFDKKRGSKQTFNGAFEKIQLDEVLSRRLNQLARKQGASLYQVMLAGFNVLLHKYSGQQDFAVGTPIANRNRSELESIIGFFVNTLALRAHFEAGESFVQQLERVREHSLDAYAYQDVPFERLVDELNVPREMSHSPIFQVMFNLVNGPSQGSVQLPGLKISSVGEKHENVKFDLMLDLAEIDGKIQGSLGFNTDLFLPGTAASMVTHFATLLLEVVNNPELPLDQLNWLSKEEQHKQLIEWNRTQVDYPKDKTIHQWFSEQVQKTPENIAIKFADTSLTYVQLDERSNQIARFLADTGVSVGDTVGLCLDRCIELMPAVIGILKAGGTYVPLDASYPHGRISYIIENANISRVLTRSDIEKGLPEGSWQYIPLDQQGIDDADNTAVPLCGDAEQLLYMIYTSGSTGRPKGTGAYHRSEVNLLSWYCREFDMTSQDNVLLMSAIGFDLTQKNLFAPLVTGATLVIPHAQEYDPAIFIRLIEQQEISWLNCAPSAFYPLQDDAADWSSLASLTRVFLGGEAINLPRLQGWFENAHCELINSYGPTECTDIASWHRVDVTSDIQSGVVPIGRPNDNVKLYVVDDANKILPIGAIGELCIGGDSVGPGYVFNSELSSDVFVSNPNIKSNDVMYKTGDLVRYRQDGLLDYLGRRDHQVKLRGFRIEIEEIQAVINEQDDISESLVAVVNHPSMGQQLIAWVVVGELLIAKTSEKEQIESRLKQQLSNLLPGYMVPSAFVLLAGFPLTPNGKVDRASLPAAQIEGSVDEFVLPGGETETALASIFAAVLGIDNVGATHNFFDIGGHSLLATQAVGRIKSQFSVELPLRDMFEGPTVREIAQLIDAAVASGVQVNVPDLVVVDRNGFLPLSFVQQQLWLLDQLEPGTSAYNMPIALRLKGELDVKILNAAISTIVERHETLRSNFISDGDSPRVIIHEATPWNINVVDLSGLSVDEQEFQISLRSKEEFGKGFDLSSGPLYRTTLLQLASEDGTEQEWVFLSTMHHMISDGWSMDVMVQELGMLYAALKDQSRAPLPNLPIQYVDYAAWQRQWMQGDELDRQVSYWREQLDNEYGVLDLPTDFPRPSVQSSNGAAVKLEVAESTVENLERLAKGQGATLFMALLTAFNVVLHRYSGQERINVGIPIAGRNRSEIEPLIGMFINTVVVGADVSGAPTFIELLDRVKNQSLGAFSHQALPFEKIVAELKPKRDLSRTPFFQVFFNLLNLPETAQRVSGLSIESLVADADGAHAKYDLNLYAKQTPDGLQFYMVYNSDLFKRETIERMLNHLNQYLDVVATSPETSIYEVALETVNCATPDIERIINEVEFEHPVVELQRMAQESSNDIAIRDKNGDITYMELTRKVDALAEVLVSVGASIDGGLEGRTIGIYAQRNSALVISILAVLRSGAAFFILDPAYPEERLSKYVEIAKPVAAINLHEVLSPQLQATLTEYVGSNVLSITNNGDLVAPCVNSISIPDVFDVKRLAYVAFTSGTTGEPKAIAGTLNPVAHFVNWYKREYALSSEDTFSLLSGLAHDPLLRDIFVPLSIGATISIPNAEVMNNPGELVQWLINENISVMHLTPAMGQLITGAVEWDTEVGVPESHQLPNLRYAVFGGDRLYVGGVRALSAYASQVSCINFYGATETPQAMAHHLITLGGSEKDTQWLPIGSGIEDVQVLVVTEKGGVATPNEVGEIVVRSPYLSSGYLNDENDESPFVANPLTFCPDDRVYRTGDRGRYLADGSVEFLGRIDQQIKIRGYRVELIEIQQALNDLEGVKQSVVVDCLDRRGDISLVAYVVCQESELGLSDGLDIDNVRMHLRSRLPEYMLPAAFIDISQIPLTPNGKLDRHRLPDPATAFVEDLYVAPRNDIEHAIADIWQVILKIEKVSVLSNFFDVGGHSLLATQIVSRVEALYEVKFPLKVLFQSASIEGMANYIDTTLWARGGLEAEEVEGEDDDDMEEFEL